MSNGHHLTSSGRAFAHMDDLIARSAPVKVTRAHIARLAGVSEQVVYHNGRITPEIEQCILAVTDRHVALRPPRYIEADIARRHVRWLLAESGCTVLDVAKATDGALRSQTVHNLLNPDLAQRTVQFKTHAALTSLRPGDLCAVSIWTLREPSLVRLRALMANGWTHEALSEIGGFHTADVVRFDSDTIRVHRARQIEALYQRIGDTQGPSILSARRARARGALPTIYYDDDMSVAEPDEVVEVPPEQADARMHLCVLALTLKGMLYEEIKGAVGASERTIRAARTEFGVSIIRPGKTDSEVAAPKGLQMAVQAAVRHVDYHHCPDDAIEAADLDYVALLDGVRSAMASAA